LRFEREQQRVYNFLQVFFIDHAANKLKRAPADGNVLIVKTIDDGLLVIGD
jgi:hypothetical protein